MYFDFSLAVSKFQMIAEHLMRRLYLTKFLAISRPRFLTATYMNLVSLAFVCNQHMVQQ